MASVSAQRLIKALTNQVLVELSKVEQTAVDAKQTAERAELTANEAIDAADDAETEARGPNRLQAAKRVTADEMRLLNAIQDHREPRPTTEQVARPAKMEISMARSLLEKLEGQKLVRQRLYEDGHKGWRVRSSGKRPLRPA